MVDKTAPPEPAFDYSLGSVWLIDKPAGWTSFRVVGLVRKLTGVRKTGHAGTLDPLATGLLIVCTGKATKAITGMVGHDKRYACEIRLGSSTPSYDSETEPDQHMPFDHVDRRMLVDVLEKQFTGTIKQMPPMYSAIKHKGQPLYRYARKGVQIEREPRMVTFHETRLNTFDPATGIISLNVFCSKGTYIRSLAHDLGLALGTRAHLISLRREQSGPYTLDNALDTETILEKLDKDGRNPVSV
jgi:tRNA pseudouridine55 synthase